MIIMFWALTYAYNNTTKPVCCTSSVFGSLDSRVTQKFEQMYYDNIAQTYGAFAGSNGGKYQVEDIMALVHLLFSLNGI